jgi:thiosulfate dehydrogenase [quinone] large subunit
MTNLSPFFVLRIGMGLNLLMHGLVRMPKLVAFADKTAADFQQTLLPAYLVRALAFGLPVVEQLVGLLLLVGGLFSRAGMVAGGLLMAVLMAGTSLREDWATVGIQVVYLIAFTFGVYLYDLRHPVQLKP